MTIMTNRTNMANTLDPADVGKRSHSTLLKVEDLTVRFGSKVVLERVSACFRAGETVAIVGRNGTGKSTFMKAVAGIADAEGRTTLEVDGRVVSQKEASRLIAYVPQLARVESRLSVFEMVMLGLSRELGWRVTPEVLARVDETLHEMRINRFAEKPVAALSGGQRQLVFMAQAFVAKPRVLLLDEPTSALDLRHQLIVMNAARDYARREGAVTIVVVHDLMLAARFADRILLLKDGIFAADAAPDEVLTPEQIADVWKVDVEVDRTKGGFLAVTPLSPRWDPETDGHEGDEPPSGDHHHHHHDGLDHDHDHIHPHGDEHPHRH